MPQKPSTGGPPTVVAQATPPGISALATVRLTGPKTIEVLSKITQKRVSFFKRGRASLVYVYNSFGQPLDQVIITFYKAPNSYTGEDVADISCHGGLSTPKSIVSACIGLGAVPSPPGEFTKRAFINGKLDLSQAEAVADIIRAKTEKSQRIGVAALGGMLSKEISAIREELVFIIGRLSVELDFLGHEVAATNNAVWATKTSLIKTKLSSLLDTFSGGNVFRDGAQVVITGEPNVGKSSLLNTIIKEERVIVSGEPGTTTDAVDAHYDVDGIPVLFVDTAGIRKSKTQIETIGAGIAKNYLSSAALVLWVWSAENLPHELDKTIENPHFDAPFIIVINKLDLIEKGCLDAALSTISCKYHLVSVKTGENISCLLSTIKTMLAKDVSADQPLLTNKRHKRSIKKALNSLNNAFVAFELEEPNELVLSDLGVCLSHLDSILGITAPDEILDSVFNEFCVGK